MVGIVDGQAITATHVALPVGRGFFPKLAADLPVAAVATPIVDVALRIGGAWREVGLKLEGRNPGGSIKARTAAALVHRLERGGVIGPGDALVESTSGNLGVALARICAARGYSFTAVLDPKVDPAVVGRMREHGAEIVMVDRADAAGGYLLTRLAEVRRLMDRRSMVWPNQYENPANPAVHFGHTGPELLRQRPCLDAVFVATSTGGTLAGIGRYLHAAAPGAQVVGVDVHGSLVFTNRPAPRLLSGIGASRRSSFLRPGDYDHFRLISDRVAIAACHTIRAGVGISLGGSSGATVAACARFLASHPDVRHPVCICPDGGANYANTIFSPHWLDAHGIAPAADASNLPFDDVRAGRR